jgi:hypothetical protein
LATVGSVACLLTSNETVPASFMPDIDPPSFNHFFVYYMCTCYSNLKLYYQIYLKYK